MDPRFEECHQLRNSIQLTSRPILHCKKEEEEEVVVEKIVI